MLDRRELVRSAMTQAVGLGLFLVAKFYLSMSPYTSFLALLMTLFVPVYVYLLQCKQQQMLEESDKMSYSLVFRYGLALFFYATIFLALGQFIYFKFVNPNCLYEMYSNAMLALERVVSSEQLEEIKSECVFSVGQMLVSSFLLNNFCGLVISLFTSAFVKKS